MRALTSVLTSDEIDEVDEVDAETSMAHKVLHAYALNRASLLCACGAAFRHSYCLLTEH